MRHRFAHVLVFLVGMLAGLTTAHATSVDVTAHVLTPVVDAQPRQTVSLHVRFANGGTGWRTVEPSVTVPAGWVVVVPPGAVTLGPGETGATMLTVLVAPDATAATYTFPITYRTTAGERIGEALFTVRVPAIDQVALTLVDAPALVSAAEPHGVEFLLRNTGNTAHEWALTATSNMGLPATLTPSTVTLGPRESAAVVALVAAPERLTQQQTHVLTVVATSRSSADVRTTARAAVLLVPTNLPAASALHTFPLTIRASYGGRALEAAASQPRLAIEVRGRGTLSDRDPGTLDLRVRMTPANLLEIATVEYQRPTWGVRFGHQDVAPSPLSASVAAFGVRGTATRPLGATDQLAGEIGTYLVGGEARFTVVATATLESGVRLGATLSGGSSELVGTLGLRYAPERRDASALQLTALEATYGVRADGDGALAHALRVTAQVNDGPSFARVTYDTAAASFDARDRHHASLRANATLRLNDAFSIQPRFPVDVALGYHHTWAWDDDLAFRLLPPAAAPRQEQRYTVRVSAGLGRASVSASYDLTDTRVAIHDRQHELRALVRTRFTDDFTVAHVGVWTRRQLLGSVLSDVLEVQTTAALRTATGGIVTTSVTVKHAFVPGSATNLAFGVRWVGEPTPDLRLVLDAELHLFDPTERWGAGLDLRYLLGDQRVLTTKLSGHARADRPFSLTFELGLTVPLHVPLGQRSDIGRLEGSITRPDGRGLHGVVVTVAGQSVTTTPDGGFVFPALPVGEHVVGVITAGGLGATEYLVPDLPAGVVIVDGVTSELRFVVHDAATVVGRIVTEALEPITGRTAIVPSGSTDAVVRGVRIELRNGVTTLRAGTDASGAFRFQRVPAGDWTLHVALPATASDYRIDPAEVRLVLEPGAIETVVLRLVPIVRHIQFDDGGTLGLDGER